MTTLEALIRSFRENHAEDTAWLSIQDCLGEIGGYDPAMRDMIFVGLTLVGLPPSHDPMRGWLPNQTRNATELRDMIRYYADEATDQYETNADSVVAIQEALAAIACDEKRVAPRLWRKYFSIWSKDALAGPILEAGSD